MVKKVIQISDVHFGDDTFSEELKSKLISQIESANPDLLIFAGDLTASGYFHEYEEAAAFVDQLRSITNTHIIPGNHDARNVGLIHFKDMIGERKFVHVDEGSKFTIIGLDSSQADVSHGQLGRDQLDWLKKELAKIPDDMAKVVTFHHHIIPIPQTGRERNILLDSGDLMHILTENGVDFVLNGHKHVPNVWMLNNMVVLNSGTPTTKRLRGNIYASYNELEINEGEVKVNLVKTETGAKKEMAHYSVEVQDESLVIHSYTHNSIHKV